jgi:hypothetical protein
MNAFAHRLALLAIGASLTVGSALSGCTVGTGGGGDGGDGDGNGDGTGGGDGNDLTLSGSITRDRTISGAATLSAAATIEPGVTVTFAAGSSLTAANAAVLTVRGTLHVDGTAAAPVAMNPVEGAAAWNGIAVESGGAARLSYATGAKVATLLHCQAGVVECTLERIDFQGIGKLLITAAPSTVKESTVTDMAGGGVVTQAGADLTVVDTVLYNSQGDLVVTSGGRLTVEYSEIGAAVGGYDHCNFHIGQAEAVTIRNSNIPDGIYAFMIGNVAGAVISGNNFTGNGTDIDEVGVVTAADFSGNYWSGGAPTFTAGIDQSNYDVSNPVTAPIATAGPRI